MPQKVKIHRLNWSQRKRISRMMSSASVESRSPSGSLKIINKTSGRRASYLIMSNRAGTELQRSASFTRSTGKRSTCGASVVSSPSSWTSWAQSKRKSRSLTVWKVTTFSELCFRATLAIRCPRAMTRTSQSPRMTRCSSSYAASVLSVVSTRLLFRMRTRRLTFSSLDKLI